MFGETGVLEKGMRNASVVATSRMRLVKLTTWEIKRLTPESIARLREVAAARRPTAEAGGDGSPVASL